MRRSLAVLRHSTVSVLSVPINLGQPLLGPDRTPELLKDGGLINVLTSLGWRVDMPAPVVSSVIGSYSEDQELNARNIREVGHVCKRLDALVSEHVAKDNFILVLGGDHCIPIGSLPPIIRARPKTAVVWVDAHADINTPEISQSGNMHGMPLGFLLGLVKNVNELPNFEQYKPSLAPADIVYIGLRDVDTAEKRLIKKLGIKAYSMYDVDKIGIGQVMDEINEYFKDRPIHLSYDIDALDPFYAPHTGTSVRGGLTFREGNYICEELYRTGRLKSMDLVEVNPMLNPLQDPKLTIDMAITLIGSAMGQSIL